MKKIKVLIVDDERSARSEITRMINAYPEVEVVGEAADADKAERLIRLLNPDLLFLDIQMPGRSGFELLEVLDQVPEVIFVTAYDSYALQAFEVSAIDYLLKPVRKERIIKSMERALQRCKGRSDSTLFIKDRGRYHLLKWSDVHLIESMDNYAKLFYGAKSVLIKTSLKKIEENPACEMFFRASRRHMFNLNYIQLVLRSGPGLEVELTTSDRILLSERQAVKFKNLQNISQSSDELSK